MRGSRSYHAARQTTKIENLKSDDTVLSSFDYAYDAVGNRTHVVEANGDRVTWTYDKTYQLTREERSGTNAYDITHSYDPVGNHLARQASGARTSYTYDAANQLSASETSSATTTCTYDATGNLELQETSSGRTTYTWDIENRLMRLWLPSGVVNTMIYNADGQRVQKEDSAGTSKFVWDLWNILLETNALGVTQSQFSLQPDTFGNLISQRRGANSHFHHFDALASTAGLTNASQVLTDAYLYKAYAEILAKTGSTTSAFRWVGRQGYFYDNDLAQYYVRGRHYDPRIARWLSRDVRDHVDTALNLLQYALGNPATLVDPSGLGIDNPYQSPEGIPEPPPWLRPALVALSPILAGCVGGAAAAVILDDIGKSIAAGRPICLSDTSLAAAVVGCFLGACTAIAVSSAIAATATLGAALAVAAPAVAGCLIIAVLACSGFDPRPWFCPM